MAEIRPRSTRDTAEMHPRYGRDRYNLLDVAIITLLVAASCLRYLLIFEGEVFEERGQVMIRLL